MNDTFAYEVILLAAGQGKRMGASCNKVLLHLAGKPIISYALATFMQDVLCCHIILVAQPGEQALLAELAATLQPSTHKKQVTIVSGGKERQDSVYSGLQALVNPNNIVMVHDGARPFVTFKQIKKLHATVKATEAAILGVPVKDTIKRVKNGLVDQTIPRDTLWQIQTPQAFYGYNLQAVHEQARQAHYLGTDEASLIEAFSDLPVTMVLGSYENIKLTTPEDLLIGEAIVQKRKLEKQNDTNRSRI
ncbi:2-C-methyl-D-erythritol 4-phosphate cytidylyltransferase [Enterococcus faecalis]